MNTNTIKAVAVASLVLSMAPAWGKVVRLPCRYLRTTYLENMETGAHINEQTKKRTVPAPIEINRAEAGKGPVIQWTTKPNGRNDGTESVTSEMPAGDLADLIAVLDSIEKTARESGRKGGKKELWSAGDLTAEFTPTNGGRSWLLLLKVGDATYELERPHCKALSAALKEI
jgi:hypothetical protein